MPRSPLAARLCEIRSPVVRLREKRGFDQPPPGSKICVAFGKRPECVQVIRQHNHPIDRKRMMPARLAKRSPQLVDVLRQQVQMPLRQIDGEEEAAPGKLGAAIVGHVAS
jgi:hypothetical protein